MSFAKPPFRTPTAALAGLVPAIVLAAASPQAVIAQETSYILPAGAKVPAWAVPQSTPAPRPAPVPPQIVAKADLNAYTETIYAPAPPTTSLARGRAITDAQGLPSGTVVSAGTRLAIVMVGPHKIQVPLSAIFDTGSALTVTLSPADLDNLLAASARFQAQTAKLVAKEATP